MTKTSGSVVDELRSMVKSSSLFEPFLRGLMMTSSDIDEILIFKPLGF